MNQERVCASDCTAYREAGKEKCRIIGALEKLANISGPGRPTRPAPLPSVSR